MAERKKKSGRLDLDVSRLEPPIWVSRLVIYESTSPLVSVFDQPLHRGLNIIWGMDDLPQTSHFEPVPGHSVGKTTCCRMIRYCLAEDHFSDEQTRELIRHEFPKGYVGAEVHVAGQVWAVARPIGRSTLSYAKTGCKVEDIFKDRPLPGSFHDYRAALIGAAIADKNPRPDLAVERVWGHLLAWCTRDQEARYESLWGWRSPRSDSNTPAFDRPKAEAIRFIRMAIGILSKKEIKIQKNLEQAIVSIEDHNKAIEERLRLPDYWSRYYREELKRLGVGQEVQGTDGNLFDSENTAEGRCAAIKKEIEQLDRELKELDTQISIKAASRNEAVQLSRGFRALAADNTMSAEERAEALASMENLLEAIKAAADQPCRFGGLNVGECSFAKDNLITVGSELQKARRDAIPEIAKFDQQAASIQERITSNAQTVKTIQEQHENLLEKRRETEDKRKELLEDINDIKVASAELNRWNQYYRNDIPDPELLTLKRKLRETDESIVKAKQDLAKERQAQEASLVRVRRLFNEIIQSVLSQEYQGGVEIGEDDLRFRVSRGKRLAGEALQTLSILLADLACMILGIEGGAVHPGFLIHDSPREADLGLRVYQNYLQFSQFLHRRLGGVERAPFQYIVTTTTPPPSDIQQSDTMAFKLNADNLLFGRILAEPTEDDAEPTGQARLL